ncbi:glycine cleavage system protein GcvH [Corallococcus praedator]|uniref:Glycine cleavage system H protein n=1 Tax=Corallococcus praedator TaxID=2316724 RepID=A0ABX9QRJ5_9BACT|nr:MULTISPECIES: glycine cleavage system protein GcvH [Corallococcus]RKH20158.1 glycine cleavage system protein GcvH [Corallococcus sp. CA047B]RKH34895.1 glycine cleavage system protein GcvH [Corallococcus sp. CA031C]RKI17095.1 glycine cleavage system protein GcvH [Corallococcus praedator]
MSDSIPQNLKYTKEHEWARVEGKTVVVGVTAHAQEALGDVVYVELPKLGTQLVEGKQFGVIESTKAVSDLYAPISGTVVKVNDELTNNPSIINSDPYGAGWIAEIEPSDAEQVGKLLDASAYGALLK